jgi:hypothetical protein
MGQNKAQKQATERAKKTAAQPEVQPAGETKQPAAEQKPAVEQKPVTQTAQPATPEPASKQTQTIEKLKAGWKAKGVNLDKLTIKDDGKFRLLIVDQGWPTVQVGASGGITVLELKSYPSAFNAAMDGHSLYEKQRAREAKKTAAAAPTAPAAKAEQKQVTA